MLCLLNEPFADPMISLDIYPDAQNRCGDDQPAYALKVFAREGILYLNTRNRIALGVLPLLGVSFGLYKKRLEDMQYKLNSRRLR